MRRILLLIAIILIFSGTSQFLQSILFVFALFSDLFVALALAGALLMLISSKISFKIWLNTASAWMLATAGLAVAPRVLPAGIMPRLPVLYGMFLQSIDPYVYAWILTLVWAITPILLLLWWMKYNKKLDLLNRYQRL